MNERGSQNLIGGETPDILESVGFRQTLRQMRDRVGGGDANIQ